MTSLKSLKWQELKIILEKTHCDFLYTLMHWLQHFQFTSLEVLISLTGLADLIMREKKSFVISDNVIMNSPSKLDQNICKCGPAILQNIMEKALCVHYCLRLDIYLNSRTFIKVDKPLRTRWRAFKTCFSHICLLTENAELWGGGKNRPLTGKLINCIFITKKKEKLNNDWPY